MVITDYMTESLLGNFLSERFSVEFIHNKGVPSIKGFKGRPDYRNDEHMLIIEFDGDRHYSNAEVILRDLYKDKVLKDHGYTVIRVPYFVQFSSDVITDLFAPYCHRFAPFNSFPHGFISDRALLPANFCELGLHRFKLDLERFSFLSADIVNSLRAKVDQLGDARFVVPPSMFDLIA